MDDLWCEKTDILLPGDVLLLRSKGKMAYLNRLSQRTLRLTRPLRRAKFTHVALVMNSTHIADAMPGQGVRIRSWQDAAASYEFEHCVAARHPAMWSEPGKHELLLARVQFYYSQPYKLWSLATRKPRHDKGLVCSQFVALVLNDLGLPPVVGSAMQGLPSDIDHNTRGKNGWVQFPLPRNGLAPGFSGAIGQVMSASMAQLELVSRLSAELDRVVLKQIEWLDRMRDEDRLRELVLSGQASGEAAPAPSFTGGITAAELLDEWRALYVDREPAVARVLADEDAPQRLARFQAIFGKNIRQMSDVVQLAIVQARDLDALGMRLKERVEQRDLLALDHIPQLHEAGAALLRSMEWLTAEPDLSDEAIEARFARYGEVAKALPAVREKLGVQSEAQASDQLMALMELERACFEWANTRRIAARWTDTFACLLALPAEGGKPGTEP
jgi:hypothetical protein